MRSLYLVCYDISEPRTLQRVHRYLLGYKVGGQKSFYECWLTAAELRQVEADLAEMIDVATDRVHIFQLDPRMRPTLLGVAQRAQYLPFLVI